METLKAELVVIGSGPAGQKAAIQAAKLGKKVFLIEKDNTLGGSSLHSGTIPSKSLREAILDLTDFYSKSFYGKEREPRSISINDLNYRLHKVISEQTRVLLTQIEKNHIQWIQGSASFISPYEIVVGDKIIQSDYYLLAPGSKPHNPTEIPFDGQRVFDSTRLLSIDYLPKTMIVLGAGIIGSEYASFFAALGTKVSLIDRKDHMLPSLDREIGLHLQTALIHLGLNFAGGKIFRAIQYGGEGVEVYFEDGSIQTAEMLLYALGRIGNVSDLNLDAAGISVDARGFIPVNALFQTVQPHIYAAGDVIGAPSLASTSMEQGRLAVRHAFGAKAHHFPSFYPIGIYTIPEISSCGYTEEHLKELGFRYLIGRAYYYEIARNQIKGSDFGMFKILFHADTLEILGIHIIGREATEVIHIGQVAMSFHARIDYFIDQIFNYPTYAEGYRIAALNGMNKVHYKK